jgi:MFS family permease
MNKVLRVISLIMFIIAFFVPVWSENIASIGMDSETQQYSGIQTLVMGVYNLAFVLPALIFLILGRKKQVFYTVSIAFSIISVGLMCVWAFGAGK